MRISSNPDVRRLNFPVINLQKFKSFVNIRCLISLILIFIKLRAVARKAKAVPKPQLLKIAIQKRATVTGTKSLLPNPTTAIATRGPSTAAEVAVRRTVVYDGNHLQ
jgi:hypothetical protein